jgi:hypothetical protein
MDSIIVELDAVLQKFNPSSLKKLLPPPDKNLVVAKMKALGINDATLEAIYTWKSGIMLTPVSGQNNQVQLFEEGCFIDLDEVIDLKLINGQENYWPTNFIAVVTDHSGQFLLLQNDINSAHYGGLFLFSPSLGIVEPEYHYQSFQMFLKTVIEAYQNNIFTYNEADDWLEVDISKYQDISATLNNR